MASEHFDLTSASVEQTAQIGIWLGRLLLPGDTICLSGDLGAGKTAIAAGIGKGWGALEPVNSPTFVFVHEHRRARDIQHLYHLDCYRLNSLEDAESVGIEDILAGDGIAVIEWPERIGELLPAECLWIKLEVPDSERPDEGGETQRQITFEASGMRYASLLGELIGQVKSNEHAAGN